MQKKARQDALIDVISAAPIASQRDLASMLTARGYRVTQASISRDLDELGVTKIGGRYVRQVDSSGGLSAAIAFDTAGPNLVVGKCASGLASAITVRIDSLKLPEIIGTIAGDDTIFVAVKTADEQAVVLNRLSEIFG